MKRTAHYLKRVGGGQFPRSLLSLAVGRDQCGKLHYHLCHTDMENANDAYLDGMFGTDIDALWLCLKQQVIDGFHSWLFLMDAVTTLADLGFWDLLEEGKWEICDHDDKDSQQESKATKGKWAGVCILENPPTIIQCRPQGQTRTLKILDCRNYGVSEWASLYAAPLPANDGRCEASAKANAINVFVRQLVALVKATKLGSLKATAASQAMHAYRHRFLNKMVLVHANNISLGLERGALFAGRNECWTVSRKLERIYHLDFNAHYPSVCMGAAMPARLCGVVPGVSPNPRELQRDGYLTISEVTVHAKEPCYPVRFKRDLHRSAFIGAASGELRHWPRDGDILYPVGEFATILCGPELCMAFERDEVRRVWYTAYYEPAELFTNWSREWAVIESWAKDKASTAIIEFVKRCRNALFGKFAQWAWAWQEAPWEGAEYPFDTWYGEHPESKQSVRYRSIGWRVQHEQKLGESFESCPAITAWVYSLARVKLWQALTCAGLENVHYMDADSIWCNHTGFHALDQAGWIHQSEPGKLKIKKMHEWVCFHGLKQYEADGLTIHSGVPNNTPGGFKEGWRYRTREGVMPALMRQQQPASREIDNVVKRAGGYRHGIVTTGGRVMPYTLQVE